MKNFEDLDEFEIFDLCANKTLREIKAMEADSQIQEQAIRYYFSRLLMEHTEENPLDEDYLGKPLDILIETEEDMGLSTNDKLHIVALSQTECEGYINIKFEGCNEWYNIDMLSCQEQLELLDELCKLL